MKTVPNQDRDFVEWHGGCRRAAVWALDVDTAAVRETLGAARSGLAPLLLARYRRQPHLTIAYAGLLPEPGANPVEGVYTDADLDGDVAALAQLGQRPFDVEIGGWGSFAMAPYLGVSSDGVASLHAALAGPSDRYVPHVTIGLYAVEADLDEVAAGMAGLPDPRLTVSVSGVCLMAYATSDIAGELTTLGRFDLSTGTWRGSGQV